VLFNLYIILIGVTVGANLTLGVIVAPVVFNMSDFITLEVSKFDSGLLMGEIFVRFNYLLGFTTLAILGFELREYLFMRRDRVILISTFLSLCSSALFILYYTPYILEAQSISETTTKAFENMHRGSEIDFKILTLSLLVLLFRRLKLRRVT
jgi:hypothetical protein